jgi:hypothetical protein
MGKTLFNSLDPDPEAARQVIFDRLRAHKDWAQLEPDGQYYSNFVEYQGPPDPELFAFFVQEVFWQLVVEGILAPGVDRFNPNLPWFHVTKYGKQVVEERAANPHDPTDYLVRVQQRVVNPDATVLAYLSESLFSLRRGNLIASTVMLGIAAERVFLLLCESLAQALASPKEIKSFADVLKRFAMKPKLDYVHLKIQSLQNTNRNFPENATIMVTAMYDLLRTQRNELGHPQPTPPKLSGEDVFANLQIFPRYYEVAEKVRQFLKQNKV